MNASQGYVLINSAAGIPFRPGISNPREHSRNQATGVGVSRACDMALTADL
jgi:hypothetical protein